MNSDLTLPLLYSFLIVLVVVFVAAFLYFWIKHRIYVKYTIPRIRDAVFLEIQVPKEAAHKEDEARGEEEKKQLIAVAEQMYTTLSSAVQRKGVFRPHDYISFEVAAVDKKISFYINCSKELQDLVEKQIQAQYPYAQVERIRAYNPFKKGYAIASSELILQKKYVYPLRTYKQMESDPLSAITNAMSKLAEDEGAVIQMIISPADETWQLKPRHMALEIQHGKTPNDRSLLAKGAAEVGKGISQAVYDTKPNIDEPVHLTPMQQETVKRLEEKASRAGFKTNIRIITSSQTMIGAEAHMKNIISSFMQYSMSPFNSFKVKKKNKGKIVKDYIFRVFKDYGSKNILNTEELASIWHLPTTYTETPNIKWLLSKKAPAPINVSKEGVLLGTNIYRNVKTDIRIAREDRMRHMYMIGRTGSGKSNLMENMVIQDIRNGEGLCVVDPHGDLIENILQHIPKDRVDDVILFEPFDTERPIGLNILEVKNEEQKDFAVQEMISIFYKLVTDPAMLGPMFEHNMRNAMLTLMADEEHPGTVVDIPRIFTDTDFQKYKVDKVKDIIVKNFWEKEMAKTSDYHKSEMLGYLVSKVGRFVENSMMRNIIGQSKSGFDFREVMDNGKILLINLAKGKTGEINAKLIGLIIVSKIQMAAMSRADIPESQRKDFYLYVDEFQNFITDAFSSILSEARKYRLGLIVAHQYLGQLEQSAGAAGAGTKEVRDAVFGNAGTMLCFRIGVEDSEIMAKEFSPTFNEFDLVNVDRFNAFIKLMINGTASKPFNMAMMPPMPGGSLETAKAIRELSRLRYGKARAEVEQEILSSSKVAETLNNGEFNIEKSY